jgi:uncharacterized protein (TIGR02453 family)
MHVRDLVQFLSELSENNTRAWFAMNKPRYDLLRTEFLELVTELIKGISKFDPAVAHCNPKKALFRIHRDMRFAREGGPYKTTFSASITSTGLKRPSQGGGPAYYFHIDAGGTLLVAGGEYLPPADRLRAIRLHLQNDASGLHGVLKDRKLKKTFGTLQEEDKLVRPPKGFAPDLPQIELIKLKSFIVWTEKPVAAISGAELKKQVMMEFSHAFPLITWLRSVK